MASLDSPRKRSIDGTELPVFDDPVELVNAVISTLQEPEELTNVSQSFSNDKNLASEVQAYAKIAGKTWTFYVKSLSISIGRNTDNNGSQPLVDIDLGPAKVVSRQHASINYNLDLRCWELKVLGRNGARVNGQKVGVGIEHATPLHSGAILDVGGTQMMFILPDSPPNISEKMLDACLTKYKANMNKVRKSSNSAYPKQYTMPVNHGSQIKSFQMFDKTQLNHSPSSVSANSLQSNLDQDLSKEDAKDIKPPYSYATMITQAILSNGEGVMSLSEIYNWISSHYAYYKYSKTGWQNSIRHNLSLNKAFEKVPRRPNEPGKGMKWQISESYKDDFLNKIQSGSLSKTRRGSSVSRQLQLHLATHQQLPESQKFFQKENSKGMEFSHSRSNSLPKFGTPMQYTQVPSNSMQSNPLSYMGNQMGKGYSQPRAFGYQQTQAPQMMYGNMMPPNQQPMQSVSGTKSELSSPIRQLSDINNTTPRLPKVGGNNLFNLPPPPPQPQNHNISTTAPHAHHSRSNSYTQSQLIEGSQNFSSGNNTNNSDSINSVTNPNSTAPSAASDLALGFTSPKKIAPLEAFTPERGSKSANSNKLGVANGNNNQSSPAFWNFVQFSTPNAQTPMRKDSEESNAQNSPTFNRGHTGKNSYSKIHGKDDITPLKSDAEDDETDNKEDVEKKSRERGEEVSV